MWGATHHIVREQHSKRFQSTLPVWGATRPPVPRLRAYLISIHAPRVGSDRGSCPRWFSLRDFNPRSPCGERRFIVHLGNDSQAFQSTLPVWGATRLFYILPPRASISIHAPRVGSDRDKKRVLYILVTISIHAPRVGSDGGRYARRTRRKISIHAPRVGSDAGRANRM